MIFTHLIINPSLEKFVVAVYQIKKIADIPNDQRNQVPVGTVPVKVSEILFFFLGTFLEIEKNTMEKEEYVEKLVQ